MWSLSAPSSPYPVDPPSSSLVCGCWRPVDVVKELTLTSAALLLGRSPPRSPSWGSPRLLLRGPPSPAFYHGGLSSPAAGQRGVRPVPDRRYRGTSACLMHGQPWLGSSPVPHLAPSHDKARPQGSLDIHSVGRVEGSLGRPPEHQCAWAAGEGGGEAWEVMPGLGRGGHGREGSCGLALCRFSPGLPFNYFLFVF